MKRSGIKRQFPLCRECRSNRVRRSDQKFCSRECWVAWMQRERKGNGNPNFRNGKNLNRQDRRLRREFNLDVKGEHACRVCGSEWNIAPHHIILRSMAPSERYEIRNCLPLCQSCHSRWHTRTLVIYRSIFTEDEWTYLVSVRLSDRETMPWLDKYYPEHER